MQPRRRPLVSHTNSGGQRRHRPDYWLIMLGIGLLAVGLVVVYAISPGLSIQKSVGENYFVGKQAIAIGLGVAAFLVTAHLPVTWWRRLEKPLLLTAGVSAIAVRLFGTEINGAYRWIQVGGLSFQAAELIKFALLVWLAGFLTDRIRLQQVNNYQLTFKPLLYALLAIAFVVGVVQSDLGSTGVMLAVMAAMILIAGLPLKRIMLIGGLVVFAVIILISSSSYRRSRLSVYLNPSQDCQDAGYQACQALITVGSGGLFGMGLGRGVQAYGYLPEAANDSIFAIFAEKFGFIGTTLLIGAFGALFARLKRIIERAPDMYSRLLATGILAWLSTQTIINVGAMIGLLPLKGITLPFISYGGTSIIFVCAAIGVVFQISRYTTYGSIASETTRTSYANDNTNRRRLRGAYHPNPGSRR
ncbi:MAG: putative lipid II flippase FtsW [Candidatus Saccharibacteria bacterium]|nr:putative lipid II flippase FtsW [Candidatus Saccharibacteria bacterium]